jgi:hypothetical protein
VVKFMLSSERSKPDVELIPIIQRADGVGVELCDAETSWSLLQDIGERSRLISDPKAVGDLWSEFISRKAYRLIGYIQGFGRLRNSLNRRGHLTRILNSRERLRIIGNILRCEANYEVILSFLNERFLAENQNAMRMDE